MAAIYYAERMNISARCLKFDSVHCVFISFFFLFHLSLTSTYSFSLGWLLNKFSCISRFELTLLLTLFCLFSRHLMFIYGFDCLFNYNFIISSRFHKLITLLLVFLWIFFLASLLFANFHSRSPTHFLTFSLAVDCLHTRLLCVDFASTTLTAKLLTLSLYLSLHFALITCTSLLLLFM